MKATIGGQRKPYTLLSYDKFLYMLASAYYFFNLVFDKIIFYI
jgi:hypothetical protein